MDHKAINVSIQTIFKSTVLFTPDLHATLINLINNKCIHTLSHILTLHFHLPHGNVKGYLSGTFQDPFQ